MMQSSSLKKYAPWALGLGLLGLLVAAVAALIYRQFNTGVQVSLVVGLIGLVLAILMNPGAVTQWSGGRQARYGSNAAVMTVAFIGILVLVNYLITHNPVRWDLSENKVNTLAPQTIEALHKLTQPVKAVGFYSPQSASQQQSAKELLDRFKVEAQGKLTYEFHDPLADPVKARDYNVTRDGTLILEADGQRQEVSFATETELTSALVRFAAPGKRVAYFLTGHGEHDPKQTDGNGYSNIGDALGKQNYDVRPLNLLVTDTVPADARVVIVAGPQQALTAPEVQALSKYLAQPNAALVALLDSPAQTQQLAQGEIPSTLDAFGQYLQANWGITPRNDLIVDLTNSYPQRPTWPLGMDYGSSPITERLKNVGTFFPNARSLAYTTTVPSLTQTALVSTSAAAWGETSIDALSNAAGPAPSAKAVHGPLAMAVAVANTQTKARIVVIGNSIFGLNQITSQYAGNQDLFMGSVNWVTLDETLINLTTNTPTTRTLKLIDALTMNLIFFVVVIALPALVLVLGGVVWFLRRRHV